MKTRFKKTILSLAIVSVLLSAANGNAGETVNASADSAWRHGHKVPKTQLVSVNSAGTDSGNGVSNDPHLSANGRYVAFRSLASDLVVNDTNGSQDVFVRDLKNGKTTLASLNRAGTASGNSESFGIAMSASGRFVGFVSSASDLVENDTNGAWDIFVLDLKSGKTKLASISRTGTDSGNGESRDPVFSDNGRFVTFNSVAGDLVENDTNGTIDAFVRDFKTKTTTLVSINSTGMSSGNNWSNSRDISADGRFVLFTSYASDLGANDVNGINDGDVFVRDLKIGTTTLVSVDKTGKNGGNRSSEGVRLSADGRFVLFYSWATDLVLNDTNGQVDAFVRDLKTGITKLVSVNRVRTASGNGGSVSTDLSDDGRYVTFSSSASDLVTNDTNGKTDVFVRDLKTGKTTLVSINNLGTATGNSASFFPELSANGRFVAFYSDASDLVVNDTNGLADAFVRDLKTGIMKLVSVNRVGTASGNGGSGSPVLSADGRIVAFDSFASDLVTNDTNGTLDVFVRPIRTRP